MARILLLLILLPVLDLALMGHWFGFWNTVLFVLGTGAVGLMLIRYQGVNTLRAAQQKAAAGQAPLLEVVTGVFLAVAGFLLLHPGIITDLLALLCLIPGVRNVLSGWLARKSASLGAAGSRFGGAQFQQKSSYRQSQHKDDGVIEGEFEPVDEQANPSGEDGSRLDHHSSHKKK